MLCFGLTQEARRSRAGQEVRGGERTHGGGAASERGGAQVVYQIYISCLSNIHVISIKYTSGVNQIYI